MATKILSYTKELNQCRNVEKQKSQPQNITAKITNAYFAHTMQLAPRAQLTYILDHLHFPAFHVITSATNMSDETYKMRSPSYATTDAVVLELKRKTQIIKMLHVGSHHLDCRSFFYLALLVLIYCCVLISASTAARTVNGLEETQGGAPNLLPGTTMIRTHPNVTHSLTTLTIPSSTVAAVDFLNTSHITELSEPLNRHRLKRDVIHVPDDDDDSNYHDDEFDEYDALINNKSAKGKYIGAPCDDMKCEPRLLHVTCDKETLICGCEKNYPVQLGLTTGCAKPKKLGEQCFYDKTCKYSDENSLCVQVRHNALCECASGFHSVSYTKPTKRVFCTQDLKELTSDLPTLLGVSTGIAVLAGLICMVLHLFSKTKYPRHRNFGDANLPPPIMYSSDTVQSGRPSSRSSLRSSGSIGSYGNRRASSAGATTAGSKGILVSTSRTGSRRPSLASVHSTSSSVRSYSMMRFEKEVQQKEIRQEMKLRLARLQQQQQLTQNRPQIIIGDGLGMQHGTLSRISMPTPSPLTPNSTDELLPSVDETQEYITITTKSDLKSSMSETNTVAGATLSAIRQIATTNAPVSMSGTISTIFPTGKTIKQTQFADTAAYIGPCSTSTEAL